MLLVLPLSFCYLIASGTICTRIVVVIYFSIFFLKSDISKLFSSSRIDSLDRLFVLNILSYITLHLSLCSFTLAM